MDWIKGTNVTLFIGIAARGPNKWISSIYRLTWISGDQFNMVARGKTYSGGTTTFIFDGSTQSFNVVAVNSVTVRSKINWCIAEADIPAEF